MTAIFIEASRSELRLPVGVALPPLVVATPVVQANGQGHRQGGDIRQHVPENLVDQSTHDLDPEASRISRDQARELKRLAQAAFGYAAGERQLRQALGLADDARLTLMRVCKHTTPAQYAALVEAYAAELGAPPEAGAEPA